LAPRFLLWLRDWIGYDSVEAVKLTPVLLREESEVESKINGHEFPFMVECTARARHPEPYWRIEIAKEPHHAE
jgi:hypothetical protein